MADLKWKRYNEGSAVVLALSGPISMGNGDKTLRDLIQDLLAEGKSRVVIDLAAVPGMDSTGLGELVAAYTSARNRGAVLKLANLTRKVKDLLVITKLTSVFECHDSVAEAAASFEK